MGRLLVKKLHPDAKVPTSVYPREDLGYDIYALEDTFLEPNKQVIVKTGIAAVYVDAPSNWPDVPGPGQIGDSGGWYANSKLYGLEVEDRSGMAAKNGIHVLAGKIDAGYRDEIGVVMILLGLPQHRSTKMLAAIAKNPRYQHMSEAERTEALAQLDQNNIEYFQLAFGSFPGAEELGYQIKAGDKIAQLLPREILTTTVDEVEELPEGLLRGMNGYGSSGR